METSNTSYQQIESNAKDRTTKKILVGLLIVTCIALIAVSIVAGLVAHDAATASEDYCTTTDCLELAADISATLNTSVEPCDDFYHYVCDGWNNENSWTEVNTPYYGQFNAVLEKETEVFLDAMFYKTKNSLVDFESVEKAQAYFTTCQDSSVDLDDLEESEFWHILKNHTDFVDSNDAAPDAWSSTEQEAFHDTLVFLTQMGYNSLFQLETADTKEALLYQYIDLWQLYDSANNGSDGSKLISLYFPSWYEEYFGMNSTEAEELADLVASFANDINEISTVTDDAYQSYDTLIAMISTGNFSELASRDTAYVNYTKLVLDVYGIKSVDDIPAQYQYLSGGVSFFEGLSGVISSTAPTTVQAYILSSILYYYLDFKNTYSQTGYETLTDFCFDRTKEAFPFVYGYILYNTIYSDEKDEFATSMTEYIKDQGVKTEIEGSSWLDDFSKEAALKKIEAMELYIGFPERIGNGDNVDTYYKKAVQSADASWMSNLQNMAQWNYITQNSSFWGNAYNLTAGWPGIFSNSAYYGHWLTGINAFYVSSQNFFTIPVTISQPPFLDGAEGYPSSVSYGGLGMVCGHEMSHGFDPSGSQYNYNGTYVGSIFSNSSRAAYQGKMECLIEQYDAIQVDTLADGTKIYDNGTQTIGENVADNAGVTSAWVAWKKYIGQNGDDKKLYGLELSQEQLFFVGYARLWCETTRPGSYANYTGVHSPNYARVIGPLQNSEYFADAFGCESGSFMNPSDKCTVW